jgi:DNA-binding transcriptional MerR regulator
VKIGELAAACGVKASKIRFLESAGLMPTAARRLNGYRDYAAGSVEVIALLLQAQRLGFTLAEIRAATPAGGLDALNCDQILRLLRAKRAAIKTQISELAALSDSVEASIRDFESRKRLRAQAAANG